MADQLQQKFNAEHPEMHTDSATTDGSTDKLFLALLSPMELAQYKAALDKLTSSATAGAGSGGSSSTTSNQFTNAMLSCRQATGAYAYILNEIDSQRLGSGAAYSTILIAIVLVTIVILQRVFGRAAVEVAT